MEYLLLGIIIDSFSLDGTMKVLSKTTNGKMRYQTGNTVLLCDKENNMSEHKVLRYRANGNIDYVKLEGIDTPEQVKEFKGFTLKVLKDKNDLKEGYYFYSDLQGCQIVDKDDNKHGTVIAVEEFPAQITLRVQEGKRTYFVPFVEAFIKKVDIDNKVIVVEFIEGML